jgi:hypothetical protein
MSVMKLWQTRTISSFNGRKREADISKIQGDDVGRFQAAFFATEAIKLKDGESEGGKGMPKVVFNESLVAGGALPASLKADFLEWLKSKTDHVTLVGAALVAEEEEDDGAAEELQRCRDETKHCRDAMRALAKTGLALALQERDQAKRAERLMREALEAKAKEIRDEELRLDHIHTLPAVQPRPAIIAPPPAEYERVEMMMPTPPMAYPAVVTSYGQPPSYGQPLPLFRPRPWGRGQPAPHHPRLPPPPRSSIGEAATRIADVGSSIGTIISALLSPNHCRAERRK